MEAVLESFFVWLPGQEMESTCFEIPQKLQWSSMKDPLIFHNCIFDI